jgi:hypothetical protein
MPQIDAKHQKENDMISEWKEKKVHANEKEMGYSHP